MKTLLDVIVECAIEDREGQEFWKDTFLGQYLVPWFVQHRGKICYGCVSVLRIKCFSSPLNQTIRNSFVDAFYEFLGLKHLGSKTSGSVYKYLDMLNFKARGRRSFSGSNPLSSKPGDVDQKGKKHLEVFSDCASGPLTESEADNVIKYRCLKAILGKSLSRFHI